MDKDTGGLAVPNVWLYFMATDGIVGVVDIRLLVDKKRGRGKFFPIPNTFFDL